MNTNPQVIKVKINNWQNRRAIIVEPHHVTLQVTSGSCNCSTCMDRVSSLRRTLAGKPEVEHAWVRNSAGDHCLVLPRRNSEKLAELLSRTLDLQVVR